MARRPSSVCVRLVRAVVTAAILVSAARADAAEPPRPAPPPPGAWDAIELTVAAGYLRGPSGYGGTSAVDGAQGLGVDLGVGVRTRRWWAGVVGEYADFRWDGAEDLSTVKAGLGFTYHFVPDAAFDPWLGASAGYRYLRAGNTPVHGFDVLRIAVGCDVRASQLVGIGPMVAAGVEVFPWLARAGGTAGPTVERVYATAFFGLQGRFDFSPTGFGD